MRRSRDGWTAIEFLLVMLVVGLGIAPLMTLSRQQTVQSGVLDIEMRAQNLAHTIIARQLDAGYDALAREIAAGVHVVGGDAAAAAAGGDLVTAQWYVYQSADEPTLLIVTVEVQEVCNKAGQATRRGEGMGKVRTWIFKRAVSDPQLSVRGMLRGQG